jgi:glycosyltransferase involved in cell wall biosynthesis
MIVRNERAVIERCLDSALPHIHSWAIVDTGSTDGTQELIRTRLAHLPGELIERPWVDFATNRNQALELARQHGDYALLIDADDVFEADPGFALANVRGLEAPGYVLEIVDEVTCYLRDALIRLDVDWRWRGVLHEALTCSDIDHVQKLRGLHIRRIGGGARSQGEARAKYVRDSAILRDALAAEPDNARYAFYLAQSLRDAGQIEGAIAAYRHRVAMGGFAEEVYFAKYMIARLLESRQAPFGEVVAAYENAHQYRPQRAEASFYLARFLYAQQRLAPACDYASIAARTPLPKDGLFVDRNIYGWRSGDLLAYALHAFGRHDESAQVCRALLDRADLPASERPRIEGNLRAALAAAAVSPPPGAPLRHGNA